MCSKACTGGLCHRWNRLPPSVRLLCHTVFCRLNLNILQGWSLLNTGAPITMSHYSEAIK
uniref:Uncharacterized protein n=1 Tax=Ciona savignyi TaxID=51511 RepID=H2YS98_CIOSA